MNADRILIFLALKGEVKTIRCKRQRNVFRSERHTRNKLLLRVVSCFVVGVQDDEGHGANRPAPGLVLREGDLTWRCSSPGCVPRRCRLVWRGGRGSCSWPLKGVANSRIAQAVGVSIPTVVSWRRRYQAGVCGGWGTRPARGVPGRCLGSGSWPLPWRRLPRGTGSRTGGAGCWPPTWASATPPWRGCGAAMGSSPGGRGPSSTPPTPSWWAGSPTWRACTWRPPRDNAVVLCVDEKSQIQAPGRTAPMPPMQPGGIERRAHDYTRHGASALFAALQVATGRVAAVCEPRHRRTELLVFLRQVARAYPDEELHLMMDNHATHKTPEVRAWLETNPRVHVHFTPTGASWPNMVELFFSVIDRAAIRRGVFTSVKDLNTKIRAFINGWNQRRHPFTWTKTPDEILTKCQPKTN